MSEDLRTRKTTINLIATTLDEAEEVSAAMLAEYPTGANTKKPSSSPASGTIVSGLGGL